MKIKKQATSRHESTLSSMIAEFVRATESIPLYQLPAHLASFPKHWPFPRGDAYHWIPVLNRFDRILELFNQEYGLVDGPQTQPFGRRLLLKGDAEEGSTSSDQTTTDAILDTLHVSQDGDRELVENVLNFTRMLLENCGNRSLYASSERLDKLLNSTSTPLLKATLRLGHRLAQRFSAARQRLGSANLHLSLLASHYNINLDKVQKLSAPFSKGPAVSAPIFGTPSGKGKDKIADRRGDTERISPSNLVGLYALPDSTLKQEFGGVALSYYEPTPATEEATSKPTATDPPTTPTPIRRTSNMGPNRTPRQPQSAPTTDSPTTPAFTPGNPSSKTTGPKTFELSAEKVSSSDLHQLIKQGLADLPDSVHYEFLHKVRTAKLLAAGKTGRDDAIALRMLAIANSGYVYGEKEFHAKVGQQDADEPRRLQLAYQLSELVHPPSNGERGISTELQTFVLGALEALAKHKGKGADICTALSVNVNHGVLFYLVRKLVAGLGTETPAADYLEEDQWRDALFSLLNTLPVSQQRTGEGMVSAGLLEILVEALKLRTEKAERNHPKILNFLDTFVYNLRDAFQALVNAKGLDIIADMMQYEVDIAKKLAEDNKGMPQEYKTQLTDYQVPFYHQQTLRWLFKFLNHMMGHTGTNNDRLMRTLIDSAQLLTGLRTVLSNARIYGSTVWSTAVLILTSFIHNEPTSYQVIAEANLSAAFLESVAGEPAAESPEALEENNGHSDTVPNRTYAPRVPGEPLAAGILPVAEAISTLPPAFGAICLAESGMKLFQSSTALKRFFEIFESPEHIKALDADTEMPTMIGNSFDELVRHHPPLKARVLSCLSELIARVVHLCAERAEKEGIGAKLWVETAEGQLIVAGGRQALSGSQTHRRIVPQPDATGNDIVMQDTDEEATTGSVIEAVTAEQVTETEDSTKGPTTGQYIRVLCRFLSGFFSNHAMCSAYIEANGVESILDISSLACLDPRSNESRSMTEEFSRVVQVLVEQKPHIAVPSLIKRTQQALEHLEPMLDHTGAQAFFAPFTSAGTARDDGNLHNGTEYVKSLVSAFTLVGAMTLTFQSQMYNARGAHSLSSQVNLADMYACLVDSLGKLHRSCVWEELSLQRNMPAEWEKATRVKSTGFGNAEADLVFRMGTSDRPSETAAPSTTEDSSSGDAAAPEPSVAKTSVLSQESAQFKNTQILRNLLSKIPTEIAPFCQSLGKLLLFRRSLEAYQRQCATVVSDQLAQAVIDQLQYRGPQESDSAEDRYAYWVVILTSLSQLMIDANLDRPQALTLLLVSFRNLGGFEVLGDILGKFYQSALEVTQKQGEDANEESQRLLNLSLGGIKIILAFYSQITSFKIIGESQQTSTMQSRPDRDRERADYFSTAQFLVELRFAVIKPVEKIWNSDLMDKATTSIVKTSINILKSVLDCDGEHGAYATADKIPKRSKPIIKPWTPRNAGYIQQLKDADFSESLAEEALYRCCDNLNMAREYCQNQARPQSSRNPIPQYELEARGPPSSSPSRAEVVVPEPTDSVSMSSSDNTQDDEGSEAPDTQSIEMEDVSSQDETGEPSGTPVPDSRTDASGPTPHDALAYQKRMRAGNMAEAVALEDLDKARTELRQTLVDRSLDILNSHDDVTFELADLITAAVAKAADPGSMRNEIGTTLVQSLISLQSEDDFRSQGKKISASAHLLALVLQEKDFYDVIVDELKDNFVTLLGFVKIFPDQPADESSPWIGQVLLIIEKLLAEDQLPQQITWTPPTGDSTEPISADQLPEPIVGVDEKNQLFDAIMEMLPRISKDESLALSVTRVLVMLTRTRKIAARLAEKRNIQRLFLMIKQLAGITNEGLRSALMIVLRHMIEDEAMIRQIMGTEIQQMFESRDRRQTDTTGYTRQMYAHAVRAPELFVEVTNEKLQLARFDPNQRPQTLILKREEAPSAEADALPGATTGPVDAPVEEDRPKETIEPKPLLERTKTADLKVPMVENSDGVIHYLLCELLAYKEIDDTPEPAKTSEATPEVSGSEQAAPEASSSAVTTTPELSKPEKPVFKADTHPIYIYRCFLLKCLAELLQSYNRTKIEFISFSRKADPYTTTPSKPRSGVLNYLLNTLVPVGTLNHEGDLAFKKKLATSNCAIDVVVSLCHKTGEYTVPKAEAQQSPYAETEQDLLFVRKFVLEHALKAFRDANAWDEPLDMKYSRLLGISDIFSRMISQRSNGEMLTQNAELTPNLKQMAKIMYEKNFITILTTAISDIDLNFPNAKRVVKYILKPMKWLTYVAMDLSMHYDTSSAPDSADEYEISTASDDDLVDTGREETPDLFRNSTLGMFEMPHDSASEDSEDEDGEEIMYDDAYADDMEYDEDEPGDRDEVVSDDDEDMMDPDLGDIGPIEGMPGDIEIEVEMGGDEDGMGLDSDDNSEDDEGDDEEDDDDEDDMDDDDDDDDMDDDEAMEALEALEEVTGDDENASLGDDQEDDWSDDAGDFGIINGEGNLPPGALDGIVLESGTRMIDERGHMAGFLGEEMGEEDDEEGDEFDDEDIHYDVEAEDDDDDMADLGAWTGGWDEPAPPAHRHGHRLSPWMFPAGPGDRILVPAYRSHRPGAGPRVTDDGINPLLQRGGRSSGRGTEGPFRNEGMSDWVHAIENRGPRVFPSDSPVSFISNLLNAMSQGNGPVLHQAGGALHLSFNSVPMGIPHPFDSGLRREANRMREMSRSAREDPHSAITFVKASTSQRWQEEARLLYGPNAIEKGSRVVNSILKVMVPPAMEAAKKRQEEREAEAARKAKEEQALKEQQEREEREAKEKEERERQEREAAEAASRANEQTAEPQAADETASATQAQAMEGVEAGATAPEEPAEPSEPAADTRPRIMTTLRGHEYDITDLGIDLEYLDALPEELREEVLMQQVAERRQEERAQRQQQQQAQPQQAAAEPAAPSGDQPTDIDEQFLAALPPEIREELLQQEAAERRRREREENRRRNQTGGVAPQAEDMDTASFLASLDPTLRAAVLMDTDEDTLRQLPPEISAEARAYGGDRRLNQFNEYGYRRGDRRGQQEDATQKKKARPCVQMLDKAGVATLLRLMFIPQQGSAKTSLSSILRYVCENRQNRAEVISILLSILQDGSADVNAVERSFAQLSIRAKQPQQPADKTPKLSRKNGSLSINADVSPLMVVQQCLNTLTQLCDKNPAVWQFFLTEHETGVGFKNRGNRKGKAKDTKDAKATRFPVNALLTLLDRKLIVESSSIMEQLTALLKHITQPLHSLKSDKDKAKDEAEKQTDSANIPGHAIDVAPNVEQSASTSEPQTGVQDTEMTATSEAAGQPTDTATEGESSTTTAKDTDPKPEDDKSKKHRPLIPPEIPENNLRLVAKILAARECNSKVFQETLSVISNLSPIPGAKEIFGHELLGIAKDLARSTLDDLASLTVQVSKADSPTDVQGIALAKFSPASSDQTKLLRALTALDYLFDPSRDSKDKPEARAEALEPAQKEDILLSLYEDAAFAPLWEKLSGCLTVIRQRGNMLNIATTLLPLIESLMVVCKNTTLKDVPLAKMLPKEFALSSPPPENKMENLFFNFTEEHRKILNDLVRQNPKLMSGTFSLLVKNSKVLEFDNKRNYFNRKLHSRSGDRQPHPPLQLAVRRDQVFLDSFKSLYFKSADEMKYGKLSIRFHGEEGVDAGGVTREWFQVISRQMFNADYALFVPVASDRTTFHPNRLSSINPEHLMFFKFIGRIIGKALYEGRVLDCHFSRAVYKQIMGKQVNLKDMETLDLEYYKSLEWMLNNDITDIITETFSVEVEAFGEMQVVDLIDNGREIPVTEDNKHEYIRLITEHRLTGSVREQLDHFLKGFHDIVPSTLVSIFSEQELELLISGLPDINVDDWKNNTEYHNYTAASPQIQWFWRAVRTFEKEEQAKLLQFVTGTSKVPLNGFKELEGMNGFSKFNIHRDFGSKDRLPSSHTCFNQLDLPEYETYEDLRKALYTAMTAGGEYFGFA
ncbi:HECT-type E3 ubiquitin transferase [Parastagonospora nodorum]|uniref:HECT-type E3 ubiquitin transferase n=1 Tax=Phaeosphaeria nodorum (strain SN15 / ATCC MYA-4574 / FGSC 10173) TaxID=321614 RepID=A0A7U2EW69_PHANO|nr:HECT-type E3 ubiquitin transferase [Parastagonospora nodorum]QRC93832.1 HECT-type E3 ubiquitin transferase [Parastagonospora nodorum SN15]KAH3922569.1 HECT-type E3 ubiquitin transferase [Parastagonospora nodorum]KAH3942144.1 HECT-type E3 ubiquitin transferase [Parastagonospora nodorum]KAH3961338.1 HECT-type E3 ubiquitin transferase [Parastagonospora nodorum]